MLDQAHMTSLFENATEGIILTGKGGQIVLINPAAERIFGYTNSELIGQLIEVLVPNQFKPNHHLLRDGFYAKPSNRVMGHGRDLHGKRKDGTEIPVEVSLSHYVKNEELFVIAFIVDITHRKIIEQNMVRQTAELENVTTQLRKLNSDLEVKVEERTMILKEALQRLEESQEELSDALDKERQLNEIKGRFVSMASHEFRTPLSTVLSSVSLLAKYQTSDDQPKRDRHLEKIRNSVKNLNDILEDFLSLGRLDEGKVPINISGFDLNNFMAETVEDLHGLLKKDQVIHFLYEGEHTIHTDKKLLKNIFINLVTNAIKFSSEGSEIIISAERKNSETIIKFIDHGIGIANDDQEFLFSSFFRGANAMNITGTGLGLHIVKRYTDLLGGKVHVQSELNKGTTVEIIIPEKQ
ncbi:MAG: PAS domain-containing sensor histidine kinase [Gemmatimonadaceae bacterium]|nr:PAS domain-containing sensor histidine kinase [Chitinophagaceae bacterium]